MKNYFSLSGKKALIAGGVGHLGKALGHLFMEYGADAVLSDIVDADKALTVLDAMKSDNMKPYYYKCNVANRQ